MTAKEIAPKPWRVMKPGPMSYIADATGLPIYAAFENRGLVDDVIVAAVNQADSLLTALDAILPYAESRVEDLEEAKEAGQEDPAYPGAAEAFAALEAAKATAEIARGREADRDLWSVARAAPKLLDSLIWAVERFDPGMAEFYSSGLRKAREAIALAGVEEEPDTSDIPEAGPEFFKTAKLVTSEPKEPDMVAITYMLAALETVAGCPQAAPWLARLTVHGRDTVTDTRNGYEAVTHAMEVAYKQWPHLRPRRVQS